MRAFTSCVSALMLGALSSLPAAAFVSPQNDLGTRAPTARTSIIVVLPHRNRAGLDALVDAIARGRARPISHAQFVAIFAPAHQDLARVSSFLQSSGFAITRTSEDMIFATSSAATVERVFATTIHDVRSPDRADRFATAAPVHIPSAIASTIKAVVIDDLPVHVVR